MVRTFILIFSHVQYCGRRYRYEEERKERNNKRLGKGGWGTIAVLTSTEKEENHDTIGWNTICFLINALF